MEGYVCVLSTDDYLEGVLVLDYNLKALNTKYPLLCLINEEISDKTKKILDHFNIKYKTVKSIKYNTKETLHRWNHTFDKLNVFSLTEYTKLIYLDSDFLILKNIDNLFEINRFTMVTDEPFHKDTFNSSVMIVKPNMDDYNALLNLVEKYDYYNIGKIGDQNIINEFVKDKCVITLDKEYNCMRTISYEVTKDVKDPVIIHYIGQPKPFMTDDYKDEYSDIYKDYLNKVRAKIKELD